MATFVPSVPKWRWWHWLSAGRVRTWSPTAAGWLGGAFLAFIYFTEWKVIVTRIPIIRGGYPAIEVEKKESKEEADDSNDD